MCSQWVSVRLRIGTRFLDKVELTVFEVLAVLKMFKPDEMLTRINIGTKELNYPLSPIRSTRTMRTRIRRHSVHRPQ